MQSAIKSPVRQKSASRTHNKRSFHTQTAKSKKKLIPFDTFAHMATDKARSHSREIKAYWDRLSQSKRTSLFRRIKNKNEFNHFFNQKKKDYLQKDQAFKNIVEFVLPQEFCQSLKHLSINKESWLPYSYPREILFKDTESIVTKFPGKDTLRHWVLNTLDFKTSGTKNGNPEDLDNKDDLKTKKIMIWEEIQALDEALSKTIALIEKTHSLSSLTPYELETIESLYRNDVTEPAKNPKEPYEKSYCTPVIFSLNPSLFQDLQASINQLITSAAHDLTPFNKQAFLDVFENRKKVLQNIENMREKLNILIPQAKQMHSAEGNRTSLPSQLQAQ
jgi:hypothetical protein